MAMVKVPSSVADLRGLSARDVLKRPVITEKSMELSAFNKYTFYVATKANKIQIREAVEEIFGVKVTGVTTTKVRGKVRRRGRVYGQAPDRKKAVVTLREGDKIEVAGAPLFE